MQNPRLVMFGGGMEGTQRHITWVASFSWTKVLMGGSGDRR